MTTQEYLARRKLKTWKFNRIVSSDAFANVNKIHPLKQREVSSIVEKAKEDAEVKKIVIFGSATRYDCDIDSDLDICIDWCDRCYDAEGVLKPFTRKMYKAITDITKGNADVINFEDLANTYLEDSVREGVVVYEQNV